MRKSLFIFLLIIVYTSGQAQSFEGILEIDYRNESGARNAIDVYVKGNKFYMRKVFGGCDRYNAYILDTRTRILSCLSPQSPRTALSLDIDKILGIYEKKQLKPGYQIHTDHTYTVTSSSKKIAEISAIQKKAADQNATYEIWTADLKVNFSDLIPVLRVLGFWGDAEDDDNVILESKTVNKKTLKNSTINVTPVKSKVDDSVFVIDDAYQFVNLDKFLVNEYKSPRFGELVKAFTGF